MKRVLEDFEVELDFGREFVCDCRHVFFPLSEEWLWYGKVEFYGLGGCVVVCVVGCGELYLVLEREVYFGFDAFVV